MAINELGFDLDALDQLEPGQLYAALERARRATVDSLDEAHALIDMVAGWSKRAPAPAPGQRAEQVVAVLLESLARDDAITVWSNDDAVIQRMVELYAQLGADSRVRYMLARALATAATPRSLAAFARIMSTDAPQQTQDAALAFVPLFQRKNFDPNPLFPQLLDALGQPTAAAATLDLANYLFRHEIMSTHPFATRSGVLISLLGALVGRLQRLAERPQEFGSDPKQLARIVAEAISLVVPLCDALALVGDPAAEGKLRQAVELPHRRVRTEAAAALARFDREAGAEVLVEMLREPAERPRALAYLAELDMSDRATEEYATATAVAEGELAAWLAEPSQYGLPPHRMALVDSCRQYWPGYSQPVDCHLFRFEYSVGDRLYSGVGLTGPVTHAFRSDLQDLPPSDIYALFAGWHAEHPEIAEMPADELDEGQLAAWGHAQEQLTAMGYSETELVKAANFFGQEHLVVRAVRDEQPGTLVIDSGTLNWYPAPKTSRPPDATEMYYMHKGRKLLRAFNPPDDEGFDDL